MALEASYTTVISPHPSSLLKEQDKEEDAKKWSVWLLTAQIGWKLPISPVEIKIQVVNSLRTLLVFHLHRELDRPYISGQSSTPELL